jgi:hypothetical protein
MRLFATVRMESPVYFAPNLQMCFSGIPFATPAKYSRVSVFPVTVNVTGDVVTVVSYMVLRINHEQKNRPPAHPVLMVNE